MSKISEFFGLNCNDDSLNFEAAMSAQISLCQNRSVFTAEELKEFWSKHRNNLKILKLFL